MTQTLQLLFGEKKEEKKKLKTKRQDERNLDLCHAIGFIAKHDINTDGLCNKFCIFS